MLYTTPNQEATGMDTGWEKKDLILQWSDIGYSSQAYCSGIANQYGKNSMFFCVVFVVMVVVWWICLFCSFYPVFYKRKDMKLSEEEDGDGPGELQREERV